MSREEIQKRIVAITREKLGINDEKEIPEERTLDDLGADSLDKVELVMALEEEYGIEILDEDAQKVKTVGDAVALVLAKKVA